MSRKTDNCMACGEEFSIKNLKTVLARESFKICKKCLSRSNPENDYEEVKNIVNGYLKLSQHMDQELASPEVKVEPADSLIQKAIDLLKKMNPSYFVGVRKIVVDSGDSAYGHVSAGGGKDPAVIHVNLQKIKSEIQSKLGANPPKDQLEDAVVRSLAATIAHERGHVASYKEETGFPGEAPAEAEENSILKKIDAYHKALSKY